MKIRFFHLQQDIIHSLRDWKSNYDAACTVVQAASIIMNIDMDIVVFGSDSYNWNVIVLHW